MKYIIIVLILLSTIPVSSAALGDLNPITAGSSMIANGIDQSITNVANQLMGCSGSSNGSINNATASNGPPSVTDMIKSFASWTVSPFEYPTVIKIMGMSLALAIFFLFIYAILGAGYVAMSHMSTKKLELFHYLMNSNSNHNVFKNYGQNILVGCVAMMFMGWGVYMTLLLSKVLKMMIMDGITDVISPSLASVSVLYLAMAIMWILVALFFGISNIIICITAGLAFLLGALYASDRTRHLTVKWMDYFFGMVLMQVFVVLIVAVGVGSIMDIKSTSAGNLLFTSQPMIEFSMYAGLIIFVLIGCGCFVLGKIRIIKSGKKIIKMVV